MKIAFMYKLTAKTSSLLNSTSVHYLDEGKTPWLSSGLVHHYYAVLDIAECPEIFVQIILRRRMKEKQSCEYWLPGKESPINYIGGGTLVEVSISNYLADSVIPQSSDEDLLDWHLRARVATLLSGHRSLGHALASIDGVGPGKKKLVGLSQERYET